jgi:phosphoglycolate phosphatase
MKFDYVLLDLDGTLSNPVEGISKSINYAMKKMDKPLVPEELISRHIGPPLRDGFKEHLGFTEEEAELATQFFRERYLPVGMYENELIESAAELLERLSAAGKTIALATSKAEEIAVLLMEHFKLSKYLDFISGASMDASGRQNKTDIILHALKHFGVDTREKLERTVMVGDRFHDIEGAKNTGIFSVAVLSGFGKREEFEEYGAGFIAANLNDACSYILGE